MRETRSESRFISFEAIRSVDAGSYLESFIVSAVAAVIGIRVFLELTGYPQLGGAGLHIAHMLWGGLLMAVALFIVLTLVGQSPKQFAAVLGGIGFGTFIDELGKFITSDNDYFYQPTMALIYVIFILLFFFSRRIERQRQLSRRELIINAADTLVELLLDRASPEEKARALFLLEEYGPNDAVSRAILRAVNAAEVSEVTRPSLASRIAARARRVYTRLLNWRPFDNLVVVLFVGRALMFAVIGFLAASDLAERWPPPVDGQTVTHVAVLFGTATAAALGIQGIVRLPRSHLDAYRWFKRSVLVSILFVQVFLFYQDQFSAIGGLAIDLALLVGLNYLLSEESSRQETERAAASFAPVDVGQDEPAPVTSSPRDRTRAG